MKKKPLFPKLGEPMDSLQTIDHYITEGLLYIDPVRPVVIISAELHLAYSDDEVKASRWPWRWLIRHGWVERDVRYRRLMKAVSWYLNLQRGNLMSSYEARLRLAGKERDEAHTIALSRYGLHDTAVNFIVAATATPEQPLTEGEPLLLGTYQNDRVAFVEASPNPPSRRGGLQTSRSNHQKQEQ